MSLHGEFFESFSGGSIKIEIGEYKGGRDNIEWDADSVAREMVLGMQGKRLVSLVDVFEERFGESSPLLENPKRDVPIEDVLDEGEINSVDKILATVGMPTIQGLKKKKSLEILRMEMGKHAKRDAELQLLKKIHHKLLGGTK